MSKPDFLESKFSFRDKLIWNWLPGRCMLCSKWKLFGITPHKKCEDYELSR